MSNSSNTKVHIDQPGALIAVESGGAVDFRAGALYKRASVDVTGLQLYTTFLNVTLAQLNAGQVVVPGIAGLQYFITNYYVAGVGSDIAVATSVKLQTDEASPVVVTTILIAALGSNAVITGRAVIANVTNGAGFFALLTAGAAIKLVKAGSTATVATSFNVAVDYAIIG